jgi:dipeptidyl aminopeptidase/acylaminoacyl peptidase
MERDGYEADKNRLFLYDFTSDSKQYYSAQFDNNAHGLTFNKDGSRIWFTSDSLARYQVFGLDLSTGVIRHVTTGNHNYVSVADAGDFLVGAKQSMSAPTEIYRIDPVSGEETQLTFINKEILDQLSLAKVEERWIRTTDDKEMLVWVIYPPHFDPNKKYPALLYCQGGPQSSVSQFFSYRWNFQMMAANGYIVVAPNRRGVPSFGQEWNEQISGDYGGQNMKDYLSAIDAISKEPFVDANRLGAVGASYGGFSVFWLAGNHEGRFKAFIAHDGMFNLESQYLETEEMFFVNFDLGGPFWDKSNQIAQRSFANSPHHFVDKWDTPILVIHGEQDFRIAYTQGMSAFNAAVLKGVPAKYLHFHNENHWVLKPQNSLLWQRTFRDWLDQWLK